MFTVNVKQGNSYFERGTADTIDAARELAHTKAIEYVRRTIYIIPAGQVDPVESIENVVKRGKNIAVVEVLRDFVPTVAADVVADVAPVVEDAAPVADSRPRPARITRAAVEAKPWTMTADQYQYAMGVHQPMIGEISGTQYARMSKRGKARYDAKRDGEWSASAAAKDAYRAAVVAAFVAGRFALNDLDVTQDAKSRIFWEQQDRRSMLQAAMFADYSRTNRYADFSTLKVGDRIFDIISGKYGTLTKVNRKTLKYTPDCEPGAWCFGMTFTGTIGAIQRLSHNDLTAQVEALAKQTDVFGIS